MFSGAPHHSTLTLEIVSASTIGSRCLTLVVFQQSTESIVAYDVISLEIGGMLGSLGESRYGDVAESLMRAKLVVVPKPLFRVLAASA